MPRGLQMRILPATGDDASFNCIIKYEILLLLSSSGSDSYNALRGDEVNALRNEAENPTALAAAAAIKTEF